MSMFRQPKILSRSAKWSFADIGRELAQQDLLVHTVLLSGTALGRLGQTLPNL